MLDPKKDILTTHACSQTDGGKSSSANGEPPQFTTRRALPQTSRGQVERHFEPLLDDHEASALLGGIHPKTLQRLARSGQVPAYRVGRFWRYRASELDSWLRSKVNSARQALPEPLPCEESGKKP
jgi:excisionase family DNA binding protein